MADVQSPASGQFSPEFRDNHRTLSLVNPDSAGPQDGPPTPSNGGPAQASVSQLSPVIDAAAPPPQVQEVLASDVSYCDAFTHAAVNLET